MFQVRQVKIRFQMNILNLSWEKYPMLICAIAMNIMVAGGFFFQFPEAGLTGDVTKSFIYHWVHAGFLFMGYVFAFINYSTYAGIQFAGRGRVEYSKSEGSSLSTAWILFLYFLLFYGTFCSIETVSQLQSVGEYLIKVANSEKIRRGVEVASVDGGANGLIKMSSYTSLGVYSFLVHRVVQKQVSTASESILFSVSIVSIVIKTVFTLDRLSLVFVIIGLLITKNIGGRWWRMISIFTLIGLALVTIGISILRVSQEGIDGFRFIFLYSRLGLENFSIALDSNVVTWGTNSFLAPIIFVLDRIGLSYYQIPQTNFIWNPAQYGYSHLYLDFRFGSLIVVMIYGWYLAKLDADLKKNHSIFASSTIVLWGANTISGIGIMWIRSIDFYFIMLLSLFLTNFHRKVIGVTRQSVIIHRRMVKSQPV